MNKKRKSALKNVTLKKKPRTFLLFYEWSTTLMNYMTADSFRLKTNIRPQVFYH